MTHYAGCYGALDNRRPRQGGPLGEGSIEKGSLRWPWQGYDYAVALTDALAQPGPALVEVVADPLLV